MRFSGLVANAHACFRYSHTRSMDVDETLNQIFRNHIPALAVYGALCACAINTPQIMCWSILFMKRSVY